MQTEVGIKFSGNLLLVVDAESGDTEDCTRLVFRPFSENRRSFSLKRRNDKNPYTKGRVTFFTGVDRTIFETKVDLTKFLERIK